MLHNGVKLQDALLYNSDVSIVSLIVHAAKGHIRLLIEIIVYRER